MHGLVLTAVWFFGATIAILIKKKNLNYHKYVFLAIILVTLIVGVSAVWDVFEHLDRNPYDIWSP